MRKCAQLLGKVITSAAITISSAGSKNERRERLIVSRVISYFYSYVTEKCTCYLLSCQARATKSTVCGLNACNVRNARYMLPVPR